MGRGGRGGESRGSDMKNNCKAPTTGPGTEWALRRFAVVPLLHHHRDPHHPTPTAPTPTPVAAMLTTNCCSAGLHLSDCLESALGNLKENRFPLGILTFQSPLHLCCKGEQGLQAQNMLEDHRESQGMKRHSPLSLALLGPNRADNTNTQ